ncbi:hypothetical protein SAMN05192558_105404 [Actinokineospora alba]|uniref:Uncharacterized protein n=1 Tax=Actinokineospora alba TaxID=504798 RepID=A0A1H0NMM7_9PSEU|nr:hypothetical protein [Actinokineospora alba]TDP68774.1 hypothetical protein C8E96_4339 [Actinokineospora alba]SDH86377.1 hypothetical protein SAMN05421871_102454 [Actinokineospora alba]SDO93929.1 hypothetical protein SAMN05192558_105404 [Actinokineospora alba]
MAKPRPTRPVSRPAASMPRRVGLAAAFLLGFVLAFLIGSWSTGPDTTERRVEELRQEEVRRDAEQIAALNDLTSGTRDHLVPVLEAMTAAAPTAEVVQLWREVITAEMERYQSSPSVGNGVNVARTGFRDSVGQLALAVRTHEIALTAAEPLKADLLALAAEQRTAAVSTWSVAALQLDVVNVAAGNGHRHVQFSGAPDNEPEGSGTR